MTSAITWAAVLVGFWTALIGGCSPSQRDEDGLPAGGGGRGHAVVGRGIELNRDRRSDLATGVELVAVEPDGTVVVRHGGREKRARPGESFDGGDLGLRVASSDPTAQGARLYVLNCVRR